MQINEQSGRLMRETLGMSPLKTDAGIEAFNKALHSEYDQLLVVEGIRDKRIKLKRPPEISGGLYFLQLILKK